LRHFVSGSSGSSQKDPRRYITTTLSAPIREHYQSELEFCTLTNFCASGQYAAFDSTRGYPEPPYAPYIPPHPSENSAHLNEESFSTNNNVGQFLPVDQLGPTALSCQPSTGRYGTKVHLKISSPFDVVSMATPTPFLSVYFGSQKCHAELLRDSHGSGGFVYSITAEAPRILVTGNQAATVPVALVIESPNGEEISRTLVGQFTYHDPPVAGTGASPGDMRRPSRSPEHIQTDSPPKTLDAHHGPDPNTNTFDFATAPSQQTQSPYGNAFPQGNMISTYRTASFTDQHYSRVAPPPLRSPASAWQSYGPPLDRSPSVANTAINRPNLTPLPAPPANAPTLVRTSTIQSAPPGGGHGGYSPYGLYSNKAVLKVVGKLDTMAENWSQEEWDNRRRIVLFKKSQSGSTLSTTFRAVSVNERPPHSICISCIWWAEKGECFVTSVDTIYLLEQLVAAPGRFTVEEKNRIRRNLEGFHPFTVSKSKPDSEEFFKIIMAFPNPKPRNIEKDVKVFPWKILESALKKIIGKYSASPSSTLPPSQLLTPVSSAYPPLPTPPAVTIASDPTNAYAVQSVSGIGSHHQESIASPRSISVSSHAWAGYPAIASARTLSPPHKGSSPQSGPLRISTLPAVSSYDGRALTASSYGAGLHTPITHHTATTPTSARWDTTPSSYAEPYHSLSSHHHPTSHQVYSTGAYGDGAPRA
jgi:hypothetical protein